MIKINILTNYSGDFYSSIALLKEKKLSMNVEKLKKFSIKYSVELNFLNFSEIDFKNNSYKGQYFLYTSSEDPFLMYKGYILDVISGLKMQGAILIPEIHLFQAHHNKVFMEILRDILLNKIETGIESKVFGTYEDYDKISDTIELPFVIKNSFGAGSKGVTLVKQKNEKKSVPFRLSKSFVLRNFLKKVAGKWDPYSSNRNKFIIQNFIPNLNGDFKILIFGNKYYIVSREIRKNDFRASGSGNVNFNPVIIDGIFDFCKSIFEELGSPYLSLDVAYDGCRFYLIEFQALNFGTITLEKSNFYYTLKDGEWNRNEGVSILEEEFVLALKNYVNSQFIN